MRAAKRRFLIGGLGAEPPGARRRRRRYRIGSPLGGRTGTAGSSPATSASLQTQARRRIGRPPRDHLACPARRRRRRPPPATEEPLWAVDRRGACPSAAFFDAHASAATGPWPINAVSVAAAGGDCPTHFRLQSRPARCRPGTKPSPGSAPPWAGGGAADVRSGRRLRRPRSIMLLPSTTEQLRCPEEGGGALARRVTGPGWHAPHLQARRRPGPGRWAPPMGGRVGTCGARAARGATDSWPRLMVWK